MKTQRIRIRVCIDDQAHWRAIGSSATRWEPTDDWMLRRMPSDSRNCVLFWIEADVPVPEASEVIEGRVVE